MSGYQRLYERWTCCRYWKRDVLCNMPIVLRTFALSVLVVIVMQLAGCSATPLDKSSESIAAYKQATEPTTTEVLPIPPEQLTVDQALVIVGRFLNDEKMSMSDLARLIISGDIPMKQATENIAHGFIDLRKTRHALWYDMVRRSTFREGWFEDGRFEELRVTSTKCFSRSSLDKAMKASPRQVIPEFHQIKDYVFTREEFLYPGWRIAYEIGKKDVTVLFAFKDCAWVIEVSSKYKRGR